MVSSSEISKGDNKKPSKDVSDSSQKSTNGTSLLKKKFKSGGEKRNQKNVRKQNIEMLIYHRENTRKRIVFI